VILTGPEILRQYRLGKINIEPFNEERINPNSYNLRLAPQLAVYTSTSGDYDLAESVAHETSLPVVRLDCRADNPLWRFEIPTKGLVLYPGKLYLGSTVEVTATDDFVPILEGRSSLARLGISVHQTGGFGDVGFHGQWTLEITCVEPVRIYADMEVCQVQFLTCEGARQLYKGKYCDQKGPTPSKLYTEME